MLSCIFQILGKEQNKAFTQFGPDFFRGAQHITMLASE